MSHYRKIEVIETTDEEIKILVKRDHHADVEMKINFFASWMAVETLRRYAGAKLRRKEIRIPDLSV